MKIQHSILGLTIIAFGISQTASSQKLYSTSPVTDALFSVDVQSNVTSQLVFFNTLELDQPIGNLVHIGNGDLIGLTFHSQSAYGGIYQTSATKDTFISLFQFTNNNRVQSSLVLANNSKLYALGNTGTVNESGIYSFDLSSNAFTKEYEIDGHAGSGILGGMVKASNGILYGVTRKGGESDLGIIFSYNSDSSTFTKLYDFNGTDGAKPEAAMIQAANGKLYGVTSYGGGSDQGVLFSFDITSNTYTKLYEFNPSMGISPTSPIYQALDGKLYGTTSTGGGSAQGVLYCYDLTSNEYTVLYSFSSTDGYSPRTAPIEGSEGKFFGTTNQGGAGNKGSIYSFEVSSATFAKLFDGNFGLGNFTSPFIRLDEISPSGIEKNKEIEQFSVYPNPASDFIEVKAQQNIVGSIFTILDQKGAQVLSGKLKSQSTKIDIGTLPAGIYFFQLGQSGQQSFKIIKK